MKKVNSYYLIKQVKLCSLLLLTLCYNSSYCQSQRNDWLKKLNTEIQQSGRYDAEKLNRIDSLHTIGSHKNESSFDHYLKLYEEFAIFNFDSAFYYARKLQETASGLNDPSLIKYSRIKTGFILLSSGMFKEVFDSLSNLSPDGLVASRKAEYYILKARSYFDLADYNSDTIFSQLYITEADRYIDSSLALLPVNSFQFLYYKGLKNLRANDIRQASGYFKSLINDPALSIHQQAIINSTYSDIYIRRQMTDSAVILLVKAAIADIQSSTKETTAILNLATLLFKLGDLENASTFIQKAAYDAKIYGARQRMVQLSTILPLIEAERVADMEKEKNSVTRYATIITPLFIFLIILSFIIVRQVRKMKIQQKEINQKNVSLHHLVEEKEWLLKEIHHRVKNNLHTITSLLESQAAYLQNDALTAIRDSQHRVYAMSLIHQKLYQPEKNVSDIDIPVYIHELVNYLKESFETERRIKFRMDLEPIALDISLAVPLGLILNEAITNSVKYAFPNQREGMITISIRKTTEDAIQFSVADDGIGLPEGLEVTKTRSLGLKLMKGLSEDIVAKFYIENRQGTRITIEFNIEKSSQHLQNISSSGNN